MSLANGLTIMVLEDHDFQRKSISRVLQKLCFDHIHQGRHGLDGLSLLNKHPNIDMIICDLDMPEMDGIEFMRHLSGLGHQASVIISSAKEQSLINTVEKMAKAYGVQLLGIIEKPFNLEQIIKLIIKHQSVKPHSLKDSTLSFSPEDILEGLIEDQFEPYFQPKIDFKSGRICGAEALARWNHPEYGIVSPYAFISILEETKNIDLLTLDMLKKASKACKKWLPHGEDLTVSINLSLAGLNDSLIVSNVSSIVDKAGIDCRNVILEITESAAMTESATALEILARLRMRGFGLSVDDYGTGFSSLKQLTRVPFTELKIDQSFVTGCAKEPSLQTIVESSIDLAKGLGLKSVGEGIEDQTDWDLLMLLGCEIGQGYFISKPISEEAFMELL
jgi:EAL domain-containing protein (putative c-di-GMP-specific phosphodiesterase class I)